MSSRPTAAARRARTARAAVFLAAAAVAAIDLSAKAVASRWGDLTPPGARLEEPLARAAAEVRAAYRQITHDNTTLATPQVIAARPGFPQASVATLRVIEAGAELAHVVAEKGGASNLAGPARALSRRAHNDVEAGLASPATEGDLVWVSPADILARRIVPVPRPVQEALAQSSATLVAASSAAAAAATIALGNYPSTAGATQPHPRQSAVDRHEIAGAPTLSAPHHTR